MGWQVYGMYMARGKQGVGKGLASKSACLDLRTSCQTLAKVLRRWVLGDNSLKMDTICISLLSVYQWHLVCCAKGENRVRDE